METFDNIVKYCMFWLTDISTYKVRLQQMQKCLQNSKTQFSLKGKFEKYITLIKEIQTAIKKLQAIEGRVIHTINMHENELYIPNVNKWSNMQNENELFDNMMYANRIVVEMQRAINNSFQENTKPEHPSILIEMPVNKKIKHQQA